MNQMPAPTSTRSGSSLAAATSSTSRAPSFTPRMLIAASPAKSSRMTSPRPTGVSAADHIAPMEPAHALATDATAKVAIRKYSTPARNPTNGPNATSTYAYRPPVSDTRLPADAKQQTMSAINTAQTM